MCVLGGGGGGRVRGRVNGVNRNKVPGHTVLYSERVPCHYSLISV